MGEHTQACEDFGDEIIPFAGRERLFHLSEASFHDSYVSLSQTV
jgi:hypothetical protein